jgi:hypothetical protein
MFVVELSGPVPGGMHATFWLTMVRHAYSQRVRLYDPFDWPFDPAPRTNSDNCITLMI